MALTFEWHARKARLNIAKHKVTFEMACDALTDPYHFHVLCDRHGNELRYSALGVSQDVALLVVYTMRAPNVRLISAREATRNESARYWNHRLLHARR